MPRKSLDNEWESMIGLFCRAHSSCRSADNHTFRGSLSREPWNKCGPISPKLFQYYHSFHSVFYSCFVSFFSGRAHLLKVLYLRIQELYRKWNGSKVRNWAMVRNQLVIDDSIKARIEKYDRLSWRRNLPAFSVPLRSTPKAGKSSIF